MTDRRQFLQLTALSAGALMLPSCTEADLETNSSLNSKAYPSNGKKPLVISTWSHGLAANEASWKVLQAGGAAIDAAEKGVRITEADLGNASVGLGGRPDRDGRVTLDACIMDHDSRCGAVACLEHIKHPIAVARAIMDRTPHVMLTAEGAYRWALEQGFERSTLELPVAESRKAWEKWKENSEYRPVINSENHDTIGLLCIDADGRMSGACTTSGMAYKIHGRVGDSPIIGSGLFIDGEVGAATATGLGEAVMRVAGSSAVVEFMRHGASPQEACEEVIQRILRKHPKTENLQVGLVAIDKHGLHGACSVYSGFNYALTHIDSHTLVDAKYFREWD